MTAALRKPKPTPADPLDVFRARCEARAYLYAVGEYELHEAIDGLQEHAERHGLVAEIGQDAVQAIMVKAFRPIVTVNADSDDPAPAQPEPAAHHVPQSTIDAADYLLTQNDPERLRKWLDEHSMADVDGILKHWKKARRR